MENFVDVISQLKKYDEKTGVVLERLCALFALYRIFEKCTTLDWVGYFTTEHSENILRTINTLLTEIRPDAVALTDGLGYVDHDLETCIGQADGNVYEAVYDWARRSPLNDPEWQHGFWKRQLSQVLDKEYLAASKTKQRSKL